MTRIMQGASGPSAGLFALAFVLAMMQPALAGEAATAGALKDYKDWVLGCDNGRACVAIGMTAQEGMLSAYLRIARAGEADAAPTAALVLYPPDDAAAVLARPMVRLAFDGHGAEGRLAGALPLEKTGDLYRLDLPGDAVPDLLAGLSRAQTLTLDLYDGAARRASKMVSLAGSSAALLAMDDQQKRVGTVSALARPGAATIDTIPPVPALPVIASLPVGVMADPLPRPPRTAATPSPDGCFAGTPPYIAFSLPGGASLWGACASAGAYNLAYDFRIFIDGKPGRPWDARVPGLTGFDETPSWLWNAYVDEDTRRLRSFMKGRGLGDCGDATDWAFDGTGFAALSYSAMDACRGVMQEDWPVLYRVRTR